MPAFTTTYNFTLPTVGSDLDVWGGYLNSNWTELDALLGGLSEKIPDTGNGVAVVSADGLVHMFKTLTLEYSASTILLATWTYPRALIGAPVSIQATPNVGDLATTGASLQKGSFVGVTAVGTANASVRIYADGANFTTGNTARVYLHAVGEAA